MKMGRLDDDRLAADAGGGQGNCPRAGTGLGKPASAPLLAANAAAAVKASPDAAEGVAAFLEKRKAVFKGNE